MKRKLLCCLLALSLICTALVFSSCKEETLPAGATVTVVVATEPEHVYTLSLDEVTGNGLMPVLEALKSKGLTYESQDLGYGAYLTAVDDLAEDGDAGVYIGIWTSVEQDKDLASVYATEKTWNGMTLTSSAVGASEMHMVDGAVIYIGTMTW